MITVATEFLVGTTEDTGRSFQINKHNFCSGKFSLHLLNPLLQLHVLHSSHVLKVAMNLFAQT